MPRQSSLTTKARRFTVTAMTKCLEEGFPWAARNESGWVVNQECFLILPPDVALISCQLELTNANGIHMQAYMELTQPISIRELKSRVDLFGGTNPNFQIARGTRDENLRY